MDGSNASFTPRGKHLIAGRWIGSEDSFLSDPAHGSAHHFAAGSPALVDEACAAAEAAFPAFASMSAERRAVFIERIADEIEARGEVITLIGTQESGLPEARIQGERGRTTGQLRLFASHIREGCHLDYRHDTALPDRAPVPRPDLRLIQRPIGPVAVFGASNFPLAFSTAGGDTAAALAAGCPVVVKGHDAHPGTSEIVADAIQAAILACDIPAGVFSLVQGGALEVGQALVKHPLIKAVGFTGSHAGGRALFDLCASRPEPIPFFGELGSVNPMFMLPEAVSDRAASLGEGWATSLAMGAGQFCTNPGIAVVIRGLEGDAFMEAARAALASTDPQVMLTSGIAEAYSRGAAEFARQPGVRALVSSEPGPREARPFLFAVEAAHWLENPVLGKEVFGPLGLVIEVKDAEQMLELAGKLCGQLTATLHMNDGDAELASRLLPVLERKAGRILANGFPTGVEVSDSMVHGGPYPASTNFGATSVGTLSIRRFLRPVCYQNLPEAILPEELR